jgi:raffinose/stachyose/melibiose transport system substrate-binding protein
MKKATILLVVIFLAASVLPVFAGGGSQAEGGGKVTTLTLLHDKDVNMAGINAVITAFEKKYNAIFEFDIHPGGADGDNVVKTRLATGSMADIFLYNTGALLHAINPDRNIVDLTNEPYADKLDGAFKTAASVNGRLYAVPTGSAGAGGWLYNKKIYRELGLQVPRTWKDLLANLEKCKAAGKTALLGAYKDSWTAQLIILADEYNVKAAYPNFPADYTANKAKYTTTPVALRSFEKYAETRQYLNSDFLATSHPEALDMLATGKGVHYPMVSGVIGNIGQMYPESVNDIGFFGQPGDDPNNHGITVWAGSGFYVYKNGSQVELSKKFDEFFVSDEGIQAYFSAIIPEGPLHIKGVSLPANVFEAIKEMLPYFDSGKTAPALEFESPVKGPNLPSLCVEVGSGNISAREAAVAYDEDVKKQAVQLNLPGW